MCLLREVVQCFLKCLSGLIQSTLNDVVLCIAPGVDLISTRAEKWSRRVFDGSFEQVTDEVDHRSFCEA